MKRVLIAWELGTNYGHLARCLAIARVLRERGHHVIFAVRDTRGAAELLSGESFSYLQAPLPSPTSRPCLPPANYTEMLLSQGYADWVTLKGLLSAWVEMLRLCRADVVLGDHAPTALIAGTIAQVPVLPIGNGFSVPPPLRPFPSFRSWENISEARLLASDLLVDDTIAQALGDFGLSPISLADLFGIEALLDTFPELDHYGERSNANYIGPIFASLGRHEVQWQNAAPKKIVAYLRPDIAGFGLLLEALQACDAEIVAIIPGLSQDHANKLASPRFRLFTSPIAWSGLLPEADLMVGYGGTGSLAESLLAGVPQLMLPRYIEQHLESLRVEAMGAGIAIGSQRGKKVFSDALGRLLSESRFRDAAIGFAKKHLSYRPQSAVMAAVAAIESAMGMNATLSRQIGELT